jgi:hypothetical protein
MEILERVEPDFAEQMRQGVQNEEWQDDEPAGW